MRASTQGTVCVTSSYYNSDYSSTNSYESDFVEVEGESSHLCLIDSLTQMGLKGYTLSKATEMISLSSTCLYGAGNIVEGVCSINYDGYVNCGNCFVSNDGTYGY
jgi:hypothetical protein